MRYKKYLKNYTTEIALGTLINNTDGIAYSSEENYFCPVKIIPTSIEYLLLKRPNHIIVLFSQIDKDWSSEFLVP